MGEYNDETEEEISLIMRALRAPISSSTKKLRGSRPDPTHNGRTFAVVEVITPPCFFYSMPILHTVFS